MITKTINNIIDFISFNSSLRKLRRQINLSIDQPEIIEELPDSHPRGFIKEFKKRRTTIAETYLRITKSLDSASYKERINALKLLAEHIVYARSLKMPLNTARVQLALMKEVVKNRNNKRKQLELLRDFTISSFGRPRDIKKYLNNLDIIELPENDKELRDLDMGWDYHVHDKTSYGRKTPIQLVIDAFIKGISELTVAYNSFDSQDAIKEVLEAGKILGIKVNIGIEFSASSNGKRFNFMYIFPEFSSRKKRFKKYLKDHLEDLQVFFTELHENQKQREISLQKLIENFNDNSLPEINKGFDSGTDYYLEPLSIDEALHSGENKISSERQLGEFLYPKYKKVLQNRVLKALSTKEIMLASRSLYRKIDVESTISRCERLRKEFSELSAESLRLKYFNHPEFLMPEKAVSSLQDIYEKTKTTGGKIKFIQPLEHGLKPAIEMVLENSGIINLIEVYNLYDTIGINEKDFVAFARFIDLFNKKDYKGIRQYFETNNLQIVCNGLEQKLINDSDRIIQPALGSDAAGRSTLVPGMGFLVKDKIVKHQKKKLLKNHFVIPNEISKVIGSYAFDNSLNGNQTNGETEIVCLGKKDSNIQNKIGDEVSFGAISPANFWEYLNPTVKIFIFILIGFFPAYYTVGLKYTLIWFGITGTRNIFADIISANGFSPRSWRLRDINWDNLSKSLFWTGFSVPVLGFVKAQFDVFYPLLKEGTLYEFLKFFFISFANGMYLASHNYLRGFDKNTIRGNFFRSVFAWPLATIFAPLGNAMIVPSIVQAKFWSDIVAAIIEGTGKYRNLLKLKRRLFNNLLPKLDANDKEAEKLAVLDILYLTNENPRAYVSLKRILLQKVNFLSGIFNKIRKRQAPAPDLSYYENLKKWFGTNDNYQQITDFIIKKYNQEQALYLIKILSGNYEKFRKWLFRIG